MKTPIPTACLALVLGLRAGHAALPAPPEAISARDPLPLPGVTADGTSSLPLFSGDGRFVVFASDAANLSGLAGPSVLNIFRRDLAAGTNALVSLNALGAPGDASSLPAAVTDDGRQVLFTSRANGLVARETGGRSQIYLRDLAAGTTTLVSVDAAGAASGDGDSLEPELAGPGRVVFASRAANLTAGDANAASDVFLRDLGTGRTVAISVRPDGATGNGDSTQPLAAAGGAVVVFHSEATDLDAATVAPAVPTDLHVRDLAGQTTRRIALTGYVLPAGRQLLETFNAVLSPDGRYLAFRTASYSVATDGGGTARYGGIHWLDLTAGTNALVTGDLLAGGVDFDGNSGPVMGPDGRTIAFELPVSVGSATVSRVHVWNADTGRHTLTDLVTGAGPGAPPPEPFVSLAPTFSPDGARLALVTDALDPVLGRPAGRLQLEVRTLATGVSRLLTVDSAGRPVGGVQLPDVAFSPDGRSVAWTAENDAVLEQDFNHAEDVLLTDLESGRTMAVSAPPPTLVDRMPQGFSSLPEANFISDDGSRILFLSSAPDVVTNDFNGLTDAFVRDRRTGTTLLVSVNTNGVAGNSGVVSASLSADGTHVAFVTRASDLVAGDTNGREDVFLRNLTTGVTRLVSRSIVTGQTGNDASGDPVLSANGRYVVFYSRARDLVPGATSLNNVFLYDEELQSLTWISRNTPGILTMLPFGIDGRSFQPVISADGRTVAFVVGQSAAGALQPVVYLRATDEFLVPEHENSLIRVSAPFLSGDGATVFYSRLAISQSTTLEAWDLPSNTRRSLYAATEGESLRAAGLSRDGRRGVFVSTRPAGVAGVLQADVLAVEVTTAVVTPVSARYGGIRAVGGADQPSISNDGRWVAFHGKADGLVVGDTNGWSDVFVRDLVTGGIVAVSRRPDGHTGDALSARPGLSGDGRTVAFRSFADDLVAGDLNHASDIFAVDLPSAIDPDADADGLPDAWELVQFGNLDHSGTADDDGDGVSNRDEFLAGTSPVDAGSVLRLQNPRVLADGTFAYEWASVAGVKYVLRFRDGLDAPWQTVPGAPVVGSGTVLGGAQPAAAASAQRFYQLMVAP